jgi:regulatory protein
MQKNKVLTEDKKIFERMYLKMVDYCNYQERCEKEIIDKLQDFEVNNNIIELVILKLKEENYLNNQRYACAYTRGKFRIKHWGRMKILQALKMKKIDNATIKIAFLEIDETEYEQTLEKLLLQKKQKENI